MEYPPSFMDFYTGVLYNRSSKYVYKRGDIVTRKSKNQCVKHLDFMILDLICLQVAFFLAYTLRHRTVNLYTNYIYATWSIVLILIDVCLLIFLNTLKNVLKRGYLVEFIATIKHVAIVELAVSYTHLTLPTTTLV